MQSCWEKKVFAPNTSFDSRWSWPFWYLFTKDCEGRYEAADWQVQVWLFILPWEQTHRCLQSCCAGLESKVPSQAQQDILRALPSNKPAKQAKLRFNQRTLLQLQEIRHAYSAFPNCQRRPWEGIPFRRGRRNSKAKNHGARRCGRLKVCSADQLTQGDGKQTQNFPWLSLISLAFHRWHAGRQTDWRGRWLPASAYRHHGRTQKRGWTSSSEISLVDWNLDYQWELRRCIWRKVYLLWSPPCLQLPHYATFQSRSR